MTPKDQMAQLAQLACLLRDRDLALLAQSSRRKAEIEAQLRRLDTSAGPVALSPVVASQIVDRFDFWRSQRRIALNQSLARETAAWITAKSAAQRSFGRAEVLGKLTKRI